MSFFIFFMFYNLFFSASLFSVCSEVLFDSKHLFHMVSRDDLLTLSTNTEITSCVVDAICMMINVDFSKFSNALRLPRFVFSTGCSVSHFNNTFYFFMVTHAICYF